MSLPVPPLTLFAIPLGLAGLGGAWAAAETAGVAPRWPEEVFFAASLAFWLVFAALYLAGGVGRRGVFAADRRHPVSGPFAAFIPIVGILLNAHYGFLYPGAALWLCLLLVAALAVVDGQLIAHWLTGQLGRDSLHMGYFLPVVAGSFIASIGLSSVHLRDIAVAAFGVGVFFFLVLGGIVIARLVGGSELPVPIRPSLAILLAAPATGGVALFLESGGVPNDLQLAFAGIATLMLLVQLLLIPYYRRVPFGLGYWNFTFPIAAAANYTVRWITGYAFPGRDAVVAVVLAIATLAVLTIAAFSIRYVIRSRRNSTTRARAA